MQKEKEQRKERKQIQSNIVILIFMYINVCCFFFLSIWFDRETKKEKYMETNSSEEKTHEQNETIREREEKYQRKEKINQWPWQKNE